MPSTTTSPSSMWEHASDSSSDATDYDDLELDFNPMHPSQSSIFRRLIGTWSLEQVVSICPSTGRPIEAPLGSRPKGLLIYSPDGYITAMLEAAEDALPQAPPLILYTGPFELAPPKQGGATGRCPDAICYDLLDSSVHHHDIGSILVRELKLHGHGPNRTLAMHMDDSKGGRDTCPLPLDILWRRQEAFSF